MANNKPPTQRGMDMANAFVQIFKNNNGDSKKMVYNPDTILYYSLFSMDYTVTINDFKSFIADNYEVIIDYLSNKYCDEYKTTEYFKHKLKHWNTCGTHEIIYALSSNNTLCLQTLHFSKDTINNKDIIVWNIDQYWHDEDVSNSVYNVETSVELCDSTKEVIHVNRFKSSTKID